MPEKAKNALLGIAKIFGLLLGILIFFDIWKILTSVYGAPPEKYEAVMAMISGPLAVNFWFFELLLGMLLPFGIILFTKGRSIKAALVAACSSMVGIFFMRYDLVVAGQLMPMREAAPGSRVQGVVNGLATYSPTASEITIVVGAILLCAGLYLAAERFLNLTED